MKKLLLATLVVAAVPLAAAASDQVIARGSGTVLDSCGDWIQQRRANKFADQAVDVSWVMGYLSGFNLLRAESEFITVPNVNVVTSWLDKECAADPTTTIWNSTMKLTFKLARDQGKSAIIPRKGT